MAKYTTEVRSICESLAGLKESVGYSHVDETIEASRSKIFDFDFPIYDEDYRSVLETKILRHYYTREIGLETVGLWKHFLERRLNEIMPYYNKLYESEMIEFNPLFDTNLTTDRSKSGSGSDSANGSSNSMGSSADHFSRNLLDERDINKANTGTVSNAENGTGVRTNTGTVRTQGSGSRDEESWDKYSDTPQGAVTGLASDNYLTNARKVTDDVDTTNDETTTNNLSENTTTQQAGTITNNLLEVINDDVHKTGTTDRSLNTNSSTTNTNTKNFTSTESYLQHIVGKNSGTSYSKLLMEFRRTFLNIDMEIINNLSDLFLNLW